MFTYSPRERGINENTRFLFNRYFPKGTSFMMLSEEGIQAEVDKLEQCTRKIQGSNSPLPNYLQSSQQN